MAGRLKPDATSGGPAKAGRYDRAKRPDERQGREEGLHERSRGVRLQPDLIAPVVLVASSFISGFVLSCIEHGQHGPRHRYEHDGHDDHDGNDW